MQSSTPTDQASNAAIDRCAEPVAVPPAWFFSTHVYCCEFDDGAIILDLHNDAYVGVDAQYLSNLRACITNWPGSDRDDSEAEPNDFSASESLIADLSSRGILTTSPTSRQPFPATNPTMALTVASRAATPRWIPLRHAAQFAISFLMVVMRLKQGGLSSVLDWLRRRQSSIHLGHSVAQNDTLERLASFFWLRAWCYTAYRRCLFDSLVLSVYLTRGAVPCTFVIGVTTKRFWEDWSLAYGFQYSQALPTIYGLPVSYLAFSLSLYLYYFLVTFERAVLFNSHFWGPSCWCCVPSAFPRTTPSTL